MCTFVPVGIPVRDLAGEHCAPAHIASGRGESADGGGLGPSKAHSPWHKHKHPTTTIIHNVFCLSVWFLLHQYGTTNPHGQTELRRQVGATQPRKFLFSLLFLVVRCPSIWAACATKSNRFQNARLFGDRQRRYERKNRQIFIGDCLKSVSVLCAAAAAVCIGINTCRKKLGFLTAIASHSDRTDDKSSELIFGVAIIIPDKNIEFSQSLAHHDKHLASTTCRLHVRHTTIVLCIK